MTTLRVAFVDVYVLRAGPVGLEVLALRRGRAGRCPGSWEAVHGSIEPGETPVAAALREMREETGLTPVRLYNLSRVESFYRHRTDEIGLIPVFAALTDGAEVQVSDEHEGYEWLTLAAASGRLSWPRERRALEDIAVMLPKGDAGVLEDVLRVE